MPFRLMDLPLELRRKVYSYIHADLGACNLDEATIRKYIERKPTAISRFIDAAFPRIRAEAFELIGGPCRMFKVLSVSSFASDEFKAMMTAYTDATQSKGFSFWDNVINIRLEPILNKDVDIGIDIGDPTRLLESLRLYKNLERVNVRYPLVPVLSPRHIREVLPNFPFVSYGRGGAINLDWTQSQKHWLALI